MANSVFTYTFRGQLKLNTFDNIVMPLLISATCVILYVPCTNIVKQIFLLYFRRREQRQRRQRRRHRRLRRRRPHLQEERQEARHLPQGGNQHPAGVALPASNGEFTLPSSSSRGNDVARKKKNEKSKKWPVGFFIHKRWQS